MSDAPTLSLTDDGLEAPDSLVGRTGQVTVEKPEITMTMTFSGEGVREYEPELAAFPTTDKEPDNVPEEHIRIDGTLYRIVDDRALNECPHCGSDKVAACDVPPKCYGCDTVLKEIPT
ncbi:hypothetical protein [Natrinema thermotolerans]|uniref:hypothetical protein n=1 Tax=Natrinema thermotolerans TaxID=121872 RepID=UPI000679769F|nr:hypothetical protein [Natrinema thermotolerans]QCC57252.1 hypothetical protein DVR14_00840 [Natrinema thermotolerans]